MKRHIKVILDSDNPFHTEIIEWMNRFERRSQGTHGDKPKRRSRLVSTHFVAALRGYIDIMEGRSRIVPVGLPQGEVEPPPPPPPEAKHPLVAFIRPVVGITTDDMGDPVGHDDDLETGTGTTTTSTDDDLNLDGGGLALTERNPLEAQPETPKTKPVSPLFRAGSVAKSSTDFSEKIPPDF